MEFGALPSLGFGESLAKACGRAMGATLPHNVLVGGLGSLVMNQTTIRTLGGHKRVKGETNIALFLRHREQEKVFGGRKTGV